MNWHRTSIIEKIGNDVKYNICKALALVTVRWTIIIRLLGL